MQEYVQLIEANQPEASIAIGAVIVVLAALIIWWLYLARRRTRVDTDTSDVLDDGHGPAMRNQALINAPPAAARDEDQAVSPTQSGGDDLTRIKGLGPKIRQMLADLGVTSFAQIAAWSDEDIDRIDAQLGKFEGRIRRDNWVEQAKLLANEDDHAYEARFGKL